MKINKKGNDGMITPQGIYNQLFRIFQFDYDSACTKENSKCAAGAFYDEGMDGLKESWQGRRVFCNPPFSGKAAWIEKARNEVENNGCHVCVMILPTNSMDSAPWHDFIYGRYNYQVINGRVSFICPTAGKPKNGNNSGTTIVFFMKKIKRD